MAGVKISALPDVLTAQLTDLFPVVQGGVTSGETLAQVQTLFGMPGGIATPAHGGTGVANSNANTVTWGGPIVFANGFTTSGAFNPTLAFTAGNTYTYPSASQTLLGLAGGTLTGTLTLNPSAQVNPNDAATISMIQAQNLKSPCTAATTGNFTATYDNGASGVGATLTGTSMAAFAPDGVTLALGNRVLFKNQTSSFQNGIYVTTTLGTGSVLPVFMRAADMDQPADFQNATTLILSGSTLSNTTWTESLAVVTIGTDPVTFVQTGFGGSVTSVATGAGLTGGPITSTGTISLDTGISLNASAPAGSLSIDSSGYVTASQNPSFSAFVTTTSSAVTGDTTIYTITGWTSSYDTTSSFNTTTGIFTAPVTGTYIFYATIGLGSLLVTNTQGQAYFAGNLPGGSSQIDYSAWGLQKTAGSNLYYPTACVIINLIASNTIKIQIQESGNGSKNVTVIGGNGNTVFAGRLIG